MNTGRAANRLSNGLVVAADVAVAAAERFLALRPRTVALAGGSTPRRLYERLARCEFPWSETEVFFGDERCVPSDHPASNYRMANEALGCRSSTWCCCAGGEDIQRGELLWKMPPGAWQDRTRYHHANC